MIFRAPVVDEIRQNFAQFAEECDFDLDRIIERLREEEARHPEQFIDRSGLASRRSTPPPNVDS